MHDRKHTIELNFDDAEIQLLNEASSINFNSVALYMRVSLLEKAERDLTKQAFRELNQQRLKNMK